MSQNGRTDSSQHATAIKRLRICTGSSQQAIAIKRLRMHRQFTASDCNHRQVHRKVLLYVPASVPMLRPVSTFAREREQKKEKLIGQLGCRTRQYVTRPCTRTRCARGYTVHLCRNSLFTPSPRKSNHWSLVVNRSCNLSRMVLVSALALVVHATCGCCCTCIQCPCAGIRCSRPHRGSRTAGCWT